MEPEEKEFMDNELRKAAQKYLSAIGAKGGQKTALRGPEYYRNIQKKSVEARRRRKKN